MYITHIGMLCLYALHIFLAYSSIINLHHFVYHSVSIMLPFHHLILIIVL